MKNYNNSGPSHRSSRFILKILLFVLIIVLAFATLYVLYINNNNDSINKPGDTSINYSPPTEAESKVGDEQKQNLNSNPPEDQTDTKPQPIKKDVTVIITDAGQYGDVIEVRSFIPDYYEDGTCTITFSKESFSFSKETPAYKDVSSTICTNPMFKTSEFKTKGTWKVIVSYESANAAGASEPREVVIK